MSAVQKAEATVSDAISCAVRRISSILPVAVLVNYTESGSSQLARITRTTEKRPILSLTTSEKTARYLTIAWGVYSVVYQNLSEIENVTKTALNIAQHQNLAKKTDILVITAGTPFGQLGSTNTLRIETIS